MSLFEQLLLRFFHMETAQTNQLLNFRLRKLGEKQVLATLEIVLILYHIGTPLCVLVSDPLELFDLFLKLSQVALMKRRESRECLILLWNSYGSFHQELHTIRLTRDLERCVRLSPVSLRREKDASPSNRLAHKMPMRLWSLSKSL
jgi:hypothetical protein